MRTVYTNAIDVRRRIVCNTKKIQNQRNRIFYTLIKKKRRRISYLLVTNSANLSLFILSKVNPYVHTRVLETALCHISAYEIKVRCVNKS